MKVFAFLLGMLVLSACGVDGPPSQPSGGINLGGEARVGVVASS